MPDFTVLPVLSMRCLCESSEVAFFLTSKTNISTIAKPQTKQLGLSSMKYLAKDGTGSAVKSGILRVWVYFAIGVSCLRVFCLYVL